MAELHQVTDADGEPTVYAFDETETTIGRSESCTAVVLDKAISRRHAVIRRGDDGYLLVDKGSANGTFVNGAKITEHKLEHDDLIRVGSTTLRFVDPPDPEATVLLNAEEEVRKAREEMKAARAQAPTPPAVEPSTPPPQPPPEAPAGPPPVAPAAEAQSPFPPPTPPAATDPPTLPPQPRMEKPPVIMPDPPSATPPPVAPPPVIMPDRPGVSPGSAAPPPVILPEPGQISASPPTAETWIDGRPFGGFWVRFLAYLIDGFIVGLAVVIINLPAIIIGVTLGNRQQALAAVVAIVCGLLSAACAILYFVFFWATRGATPGKKILKLEIIRDDGVQPLGWGKAWMRLLGYWVSGAIMDIGFIMIAFTERKRGLHDMIAHTLVVKNQS